MNKYIVVLVGEGHVDSDTLENVGWDDDYILSGPGLNPDTDIPHDLQLEYSTKSEALECIERLRDELPKWYCFLLVRQRIELDVLRFIPGNAAKE